MLRYRAVLQRSKNVECSPEIMGQEHILNRADVFGAECAEGPRHTNSLEENIVDLYATMRPSLLGYAYQVVGSAGEGEDLVQIAFLKLFDQMQRKAEILNVRSWLYRVVHNLAIDHIRRRGVHELACAEWLSARNITDVPRSTENDLIVQEQIANSLQVLNERERHCLMLRAEGLSYQEIGDVLGISQKSVSVYLARGLKKFEVRNEARA